MENEILYKRSITNKIIYWKASIDYNIVSTKYDEIYEYRLEYEHGELNTENPTISYSDIIYGKNIDKKNETSNLQQAQKELKSIYERQRKKGYKSLEDVVDLDNGNFGGCDKKIIYTEISKTGICDWLNTYLPKYNTDIDNCIKPMKCQKFQIGKFNYPCIAQPKINGVRCTISWCIDKTPKNDLFTKLGFKGYYKAIIKSKEGLEYKIEHIQNIFTEFYDKNEEYQNIVFDGELYIKDELVTTIGGAARNPSNPKHKELQFICFDLSIPNISQKDREYLRLDMHNDMSILFGDKINNLYATYNHNCIDFKNYIIHFLYGITVDNDNIALNYMEECIENGYEGAVIRDLNAEYCFGQRPKTMMKLKKFDDSEFKIIDIQTKGNPEDKVGFTIIYNLKNDINDETFDCNGTGTVEDKLNIYNNKHKYINKLATVKFYERTKNGIPFHANVIGIRNYE